MNGARYHNTPKQLSAIIVPVSFKVSILATFTSRRLEETVLFAEQGHLNIVSRSAVFIPAVILYIPTSSSTPRCLSYLRLSHLFLDAPVWKSRSTNSSLADNGGCPGYLVRVNVLFYSRDLLSDIPLKSCHPLSFPFSAQNKLTSKLGYAQYSIIK
ncbi:MAG: hypothetical protein NXY57DRAFT_43158 [Lentinula lateritia]|nr:MAG: hypothetical protein NXY57DRAFT_43158 [Lentinula lateritia]